MKHNLVILAMLGLSGYSLPALAQTVIVPPSADPGRVDEQLQPQPAPMLAAPVAVPEETTVQEIPEDAKNVSFTLENLTIDGMTVYPPQEIESLYTNLLGQTITLEDIYKVAVELTKRYQQDGYFLSKAYVPMQQITDGTVRIAVTEGYISRVERNGTVYESSIVDGILANITQSKPLNIRNLEKNLLLLNDLPGMKAKGILVPDKSDPNAVCLAVNFEDMPFVQNISFDNFGTRYLGPYQMGIRLGQNHLFAPYQQTQVAAYRSINLDELQYYYLAHSLPISSNGTKMRFNGSFSTTNPGYKLESSDVEGRSYNASVEVTHPLIRSRQENLYLTGTIDWIHSETDVLHTDLFEDDLRVARLSLNYDGSDHFNGSNFGSLELSQGINLLGASDSGDQNLSRAEADGTFTKAVLSYARLQSLDDQFDVYIATSGQLASGPLLSSEEFGYGGRSFGRGYDNSEITGDHGWNGVVELRYNKMPEIAGVKSQLYGFYDAGKVWNDDAGSKDVSGTSTGVGVRFNIDEGLSGDLGVALPLTLQRGAPESAHPNDPHLYFSLNMRF